MDYVLLATTWASGQYGKIWHKCVEVLSQVTCAREGKYYCVYKGAVSCHIAHNPSNDVFIVYTCTSLSNLHIYKALSSFTQMSKSILPSE